MNSTILLLTNTTVFDDSRCFAKSPERLKVHYSDCEDVIMGMHDRTDTRQYIFGRGRRANFRLPRYYEKGTCHITLDMVYEDQTDRLTFAEVCEEALDLAVHCTLGYNFDRGGIDTVGLRKLLHITIFGMAPKAIS